MSLELPTNLDRLVDTILTTFPQHRPFLARHFGAISGEERGFLEDLASRVSKLLATDLERACADYKWMCGVFLRYELHYRRTRSYERSAFSQVLAGIYQPESMARYMRGLLISQVTWRQHSGATRTFVELFLPRVAGRGTYLEIGPGHGLWMSFAATAGGFAQLTGWDISPDSLAQTRSGIARLGVADAPELVLHDVCKPGHATGSFDAIVASQVLEIVSSPKAALMTIAANLAQDGLLFLNVPLNASAPDHIRRWSSEAEVDALLAAAGLVPTERRRVSETADADLANTALPYAYLVFARRVQN